MSFPQPTETLLRGSGDLPAHVHRDTLTARILQLRTELQALENCFNSISPSNRIPPEILSKVFLLLARDDRLLISPNDKETLGWIRVTHVCCHWRKVALECTMLWSHISFCSPKFAGLMLSRSKKAPISVVSIRNGGPSIHDALSQALSEAERLKLVRLSSHGVNPINLTAVLSTWTRPAPLLETLMIYGITGDPVELPTGITAGHAPLLKTLHLRNCRIPSWESIPLSASLTIMHLASEFDIVRPSTDQFLTSIAAMSSLRELYLRRFLPDGRSPSSTAPEVPIYLLNLRTVTLSDDASVVGSFFEAVRVANVEKLTVDLANRQLDIDAIRPLIPKLAKSCHIQDRKGVRALEILDDSDFNEFCGPMLRLTSEPPSSQPGLNLSLLCESPHLSAVEILPLIKDYVDLSPLLALTVTGDCSLTQDDWNAFARLEHLSSIMHHYGTLSEGFLIALSGKNWEPDTDPSNGSQLASANYPSLTMLEILDMDFSASYTRGDAETLLVSSLGSRSTSCPLSTTVKVYLSTNRGLTRAMVRRIKGSLPKGMVSFVILNEPSQIWGDHQDDSEDEDAGDDIEEEEVL